MSGTVYTLIHAGAEGSMIEDFRAIAEATAPEGGPRYSEKRILTELARFLVRRTGGANRDAPFYELCHLVNAVDASESGKDRLNAFFMAPERATASRFRVRIVSSLKKGGWRRDGFALTGEGIAIAYDDGTRFMVRFGRMPFLAALYEFLAGMDDFTFYPHLQEIFDELTHRPPDVSAIQAASNRLASHFRRYRRQHLAQARQEGKFDVLLGFLMQRSPAGSVVIDDAAVLDFWETKSLAGDFRAYRTVFDAFVNFLQAFDEAGRADAVIHAAPIGLDRAKGEVEPDDSAVQLDTVEEWASPLLLLDQPPAAAIKFFKKESERRPMEHLMHYGPAALRLPLAFLRLEAFSPVQSAITTDLQIGRDRTLIERRVSCEDAESYGGIVRGLEQILEKVKRLQKAAFYALHKGVQGTINAGPMSAMEKVTADGAVAFRAVGRKGFDEAGLADEARIDGFRVGAVVLVKISAQIEHYLGAARRIGSGSRNLENWFDADRRTFKSKFSALYGVSP